jgi:hypothetical protein
VGVSIIFGAEIATDLDPEIEKICRAAVPVDGSAEYDPLTRMFSLASSPEAAFGIAQGVLNEVRRLDVARHGPLPGKTDSGGDDPQESQDGLPGVHA